MSDDRDLPGNEKRERHESFGLLSFNRVTGNPGRLFGSSLKEHYTFVRLKLVRGSRVHGTGQDWYHPEGPAMVEVDLTSSQFADLITTMNVASGSPCTIRSFDGKPVPRPPEADVESERIRSSFKAQMAKVGRQLRKKKEEIERVMATKKNITQADRKEILRSLSGFVSEIESSVPFMVSSFEEATEKTVSQAKAEVEAFTTQAVAAAGLDALLKAQEDAPAQLAGPSEEDA